MYRTLLQSANQFKDYNLRAYCLRRCRLGFEQARNVTDPASIEALQTAAREQLKLIQRQSTISNMYAGERSVMETLGR